MICAVLELFQTPRWRSGGPLPAWLETKRSFHRLKAYRQLPILRRAREEHMRRQKKKSPLEVFMQAA